MSAGHEKSNLPSLPHRAGLANLMASNPDVGDKTKRLVPTFPVEEKRVAFEEVMIGVYAYVRESELGPRRVRRLIEELTLIPRGVDGPGDPVQLYDRRKGWFGVPWRHFDDPLPELGRTIHDLRTDGFAVKFDFRSTLRAGQIPVINAFETWLQAGATAFLLEARPAFGKTVAVLQMLQMIGRTALIIVPRSNLVKQWIDRAIEHTSLLRSEIGYVVGNKWNWRGKKIVVGLVHSLALDRMGMEFRKNFGVLVADEVDHSVPPSTFAPVINLFPTKYRIGASAEMKRFDGMHIVFEKHFGQVRLVGVAGDDEVMLPAVVAVSYDRAHDKLYAGLGTMQRRGVILSKLAKDPARNMALAKYVGLLYRSDRRTVILSDRVAHLKLLFELVAKLEGIPKAEMGFYIGQMEDKARHRVAIACKVIFATYQMFALGTDIQDLAGLVYATPQSSVIQSKGRIERAIEGKKGPVVVDFVDTAYPDTIRWAAKRMAQYRKEGMIVRGQKEGMS